MLITGLLLTLSSDPRVQADVRARLGARPEVQIGAPVSRWLPLTMIATDDAPCRELHDWIQSCAGVEYVDVVCVNFEEETAGERRTPALPRPAPPSQTEEICFQP